MNKVNHIAIIMDEMVDGVKKSQKQKLWTSKRC